MVERKGSLTGSENYSSPDVGSRVKSVLQLVKQVMDRQPWSSPVSVNEINKSIPTLVDLSDRLKNILDHTPQKEEVRFQVDKGFLYVPAQSATVYIVKEPVKSGEPLQRANIIQETHWEALRKKALPDDILYSRLLQRAGGIVRLFAGGTSYLSPPVEPQTLSSAKNNVEQRNNDRKIATEAASEQLRYLQGQSQFHDICVNAAGWEIINRALGFPSGWSGNNYNLYRIILEFYLKGMFDVNFQMFEPQKEHGSKRVALRAHFLMKDGKIGCWADWESKVRAFHESDEGCGAYTSYALRLRDKLRLAIPTISGEDFNHQIIDRVS